MIFFLVVLKMVDLIYFVIFFFVDFIFKNIVFILLRGEMKSLNIKIFDIEFEMGVMVFLNLYFF